jgi:Ca2+-binding RTX toxin-like protein
VGSDSDLFRFAGAASSQVVVTLLNRNAYFCQWEGRCPEADILNPDLSVLATVAAGDYANSRLLTLPASGTYTIRVRDDNISETSSYRVGLERLFPTSTTAVHTLIDTDNPDTIDPVLDQDFYTFDGCKDDFVTVTQSGAEMKGLLYGPDQALVDTWTGSKSRDMALPQNGKYTFHFSDAWDEWNWNYETRSYSLGLACLAPAPGHAKCGECTPPPKETCNGLTPTILGTAKSERITGTAGNDVIVGLGGNDRILGLGGNDTICGNSDQAKTGSDTLLGGEGHDTLIGNGMLLGEAGNDSLKGGNARDSLLGGPGDDTLDAQGGDDLAIGGAGNDKLLGGVGANDLCDKDANDLTPATGCELRFTP